MGLADRRYDERTGRGGGGGWGGRGGFGGGPFAGHLTPWVRRLLAVNFAVWLVMALGILPARLASDLFGFSVATVLTRPWSPLTYMFVHGGFMHVLFNMVGVFFFGPPLEREMGGTAFIRYYLICGVGAALTAVLLIGLIGTPRVIGASGAVFGVMLAFAWKWPDAPIYIWGVLPVKAKWMVGVLGLFALLATMQAGGGSVAHWAHLGGLVTGVVYLQFGAGLAARFRALRRRTRRGTAPRPVHREPGSRRRGRPAGDDLDEVDRILDKIREQGIDALSADEQAFLDQMSRDYRSRPDGRA
ncbi:MAG TPA: rhomboid family intramembrane serine protease [Gemmatimonadota bacterium]|nr:rhomboid family intramembrane serine protease [Gemmatimonadota bacterium]